MGTEHNVVLSPFLFRGASYSLSFLWAAPGSLYPPCQAAGDSVGGDGARLGGIQKQEVSMESVQLPKWFPKSKTIVFNLLAVAVFAAQYLGFADFKLDPEIIALLSAVANLVLRFVTDTPVSILPVE